MAPRPPEIVSRMSAIRARSTLDNDWRQASTPQETLIVESWSQGVMLGALLIMALITIANMRRRVLLHKLILLEQLFAITHGTFCFFSFKGYGWYLSSTAALLYTSYWLHNVVAWMKIKPFLSKEWSAFYIGTVMLVIPCLIFQIFNNFRFFNNISNLYLSVRPYEPLFRDPWWVVTTVYLIWVIRAQYDISMGVLFRRGPRFGIMLVSMLCSIIFIVVDVCSSVIPHFTTTVGINPYWKFALVFKCFCDTIILDDFKTALEKLRRGVFNTYDTVRFDDGEDLASDRHRRGAVDGSSIQQPRTRSVATSSPIIGKFRRKSWVPRFGSISSSTPEATHHERAGSITFHTSDETKEQIDIEPRGRTNRVDQAREAIGKVGTKLTNLPSLGGIGSALKKGSKIRNSSSISRHSTQAETTHSGAYMTDTQSTLAKPVKPGVPDPHHIPTDQELEEDPTGRRVFEERRRVLVTRDDSDLAQTYSHPGPLSPPHPGQPWGHFSEDDEEEEEDEPWGVNQKELNSKRLSTVPARSRTTSHVERGDIPEEDSRISFIDAL